MTDEPKNKIGVLKYIASSGAKGVKFEDQPETWYNPANEEAKAQVKDEYKGKKVGIVMAPGKATDFVSMVLVNDDVPNTPEQEVEVEEVKEQEKEVSKPAAKPKAKEEKPEEVVIDNIGPGPETKEEDPCGDFMGLLNSMRTSKYTKEIYQEMATTKLETAQKGPMKLTYASWAEAWGVLKGLHPTANFKVHENKEGLPYFMSDLPMMGAFVKVTVKVEGLEHTVHLPVMDHSNKSITKDKMTTFDVNKNIQRALVKCIGMHGLGLYVYKGEDLKDI